MSQDHTPTHGARAPEPGRRGLGSVAGLVLRVLAAAALFVDAIVHARLATGYQSAAPEGFGEGNLFLAEAVAAAAAGLYVLIRGSRPAWLLALLTAGGGLAVLLLYRYIDIPAFGPFPAMYEPVWFFDKTLTALAQGAAALLAATALTLDRRSRPKTVSGTSATTGRDTP
ncbi:hypothetical protein QK292_17790 [Arthrobacter sp. AL08]|uniref:hypothetical protein n=1 Tax=unclassified Arthrobacter TaxID=235627 RepID=UPI00249CDAB7|nr:MULTISPECIES: hypothetical protein [unclassified Arthrobacter]MDI3243396.1 hypothetical protein [Arthrobacter sp. AL05]MDI3279405.1 hypothetical protein [Arthrobacter sp. AL08]